ncbi:YqiA/YcfP family alpha/beta fold hydrolase [Gallaecimonas sp. GXIMD4217]|uniref:YqiA/YcfP family alpha/beta fold hydrolase n=1 Tax=Gallaecimonas sp. GXIMD4217 TaxID=3131927 RepID=UPI00311AC686
MRLLYLHGFHSSPGSMKAQQVLSWFAYHHPDIEVLAPQLPATPMAAWEQAEALVDGRTLGVIGSSLGGFLATRLAERHPLKAVLINPAVRPAELFHDYLGPQQHPYTGECYELDQRHLAELQALTLAGIERPERFMVLQKEGDEVLDWRQARDFYRGARLHIEPGGNHAFEDLPRHLPALAQFLGAC